MSLKSKLQATALKCLLLLLLFFTGIAVQAAVTVSNVSASQRPGTKLIDITYDVANDLASKVTTSLVVLNGKTVVRAVSLTGAIGAGVTTGTGKRITWNMAADWNGKLSKNLRVIVMANDGPAAPPIPSSMVLIPGGTNAGTNPLAKEETYDDLYPQTHSLTVSAFYMDKYEVTKAQWDTVYAWSIGHGYSFDCSGSGKVANHPVTSVSWYDAVKWCNARSEKEGRPAVYLVNGSVYKTGEADNVLQTFAAGYRLPTDVEWEYAARGGVANRRFPWGNTIDRSRANYYSDWYRGKPSNSYDKAGYSGYDRRYATGSEPYTAPVGSFAPNGYGLYDMAGNVYEWCFNWCLLDEGYRAVRGGGWYEDAGWCQIGRLYDHGRPYETRTIYGFRVVLSPGQ